VIDPVGKKKAVDEEVIDRATVFIGEPIVAFDEWVFNQLVARAMTVFWRRFGSARMSSAAESEKVGRNWRLSATGDAGFEFFG
jgi:hypothetical protein